MRFVALWLTLLVTPHAWASTTICKIEGDAIGPTTVSWDTDSRKASIKLYSGETHQGHLTNVRKHNDGLKVNLVFRTIGTPFQDESEYIVFPVSETEHRIIGVGYKHLDGVRHLDISQGNHIGHCSSL